MVKGRFPSVILVIWGIMLTVSDLGVGNPEGRSQEPEDAGSSGSAVVSEMIPARTLFDDRSWQSPGAVASATNVEMSVSPNVLLKTRMASPVRLFDPTDDETITCMTDFKGKLYLGSCTRPGETTTGSIFSYDPDLHKWKKAYQVSEQGITQLVVHEGMLYVPGYDAAIVPEYDAFDASWELGNMYLFDGNKWIRRRTVPRAVHIYGLTVYRDRIYLSAAIFDEGLKGDNSESKVALYGRVVSSGDKGLTWREEYNTQISGQKVGLITTFKDQLVLNAFGDLVVSKGHEWHALNPQNASYLYVLDFAAAHDYLLLGTPFGLCYYDGNRYWRSGLLSDRGRIRGIARLGNYWVVTSSSQHAIGHGPGGMYNYPEPNGQVLKYKGHHIWFLHKDLLARDARGERIDFLEELTRKRLQLRPMQPDLPTSCHAFRGRVYIGTHPEGRVSVLPVSPQGSFESTARAIPVAATCRLHWVAATPVGTSIRFQIRTAETKAALADASYVGPDHTQKSWFTKPGARVTVAQPGFLQYRVMMETRDPALTPYLKQVTLTSLRSD
jgi:hypothetical protein